MNDPAREYRRQQMREIEALLPRAREELKRFGNVVYVTVGAKEVAGCATTEPAFQVYVKRKLPAGELSASERIPPRLLDYLTDVIEDEEGQTIVDGDGYRPLSGGSQLSQSGFGSLGVIALATAGSAAPEGDPVILTNYHVAPNNGKLVGQPSTPSECCCCECCDVGRVVDTRVTGLIDAAIATLNDDQRFSHGIVELGFVQGTVSATTLTVGDPVFKRGRTTELTAGLFSTATATPTVSGYPGGLTQAFTQQIRITAATPGAAFALKGDSGSVVVDAQNRVIGLLFSSTIPGGSPSHANRIENVTSALNIRIPVSGTPGAIPILGHGLGGGREPQPHLAAVVAELRATEVGRHWATLAERHAAEIVDLVRNHRPTTVAWQRGHGPSFLAHYIKTTRDADYTAPEEIAGVRLENLLLGMSAALQKHGSPALAEAVHAHYLSALELTRGCRRIETVIERAQSCVRGVSLSGEWSEEMSRVE